MKSLTNAEVRAWCEQRSVSWTTEDYLYFADEGRHCIAIELPNKPYQLVAMANALLPGTQASPFRGALLWIRQWGVWNELVERAGLRVMEVMRELSADMTSMDEAPGFLFDEKEMVDLQVCFIQPLLIGWDSFLIPDSGDYFVATSHDETTHVISRTEDIHQRALADLKPWHPKEDKESYFKGISIPV